MRIRTLCCREIKLEEKQLAPRITKYPLNNTSTSSIPVCDYAWHRGILIRNSDICKQRVCNQHKIARIDDAFSEKETPSNYSVCQSVSHETLSPKDHPKVLECFPQKDENSRYFPYCKRYQGIITSFSELCKSTNCSCMKKATIRKQ